jgi:hypothetical protein
MTTASWLTAFTVLAGTFHKRFYPAELSGLVHHLLRRLAGGVIPRSAADAMLVRAPCALSCRATYNLNGLTG